MRAQYIKSPYWLIDLTVCGGRKDEVTRVVAPDAGDAHLSIVMLRFGQRAAVPLPPKLTVRGYRCRAITNDSAVPALGEALRDGHILRVMSLPVSSSFKCPQVRCRTFYAVTPATEEPDRAPRCVVCNTPFLARDGASYLSYRPTNDIVERRPVQEGLPH
jgi:hypothetical protein